MGHTYSLYKVIIAFFKAEYNIRKDENNGAISSRFRQENEIMFEIGIVPRRWLWYTDR